MLMVMGMLACLGFARGCLVGDPEPLEMAWASEDAMGLEEVGEVEVTRELSVVWKQGEGVECPAPSTPRFVMYNEVPKSGSSSLNNMLNKAASSSLYAMTGAMDGIAPVAREAMRAQGSAAISERQLVSKLKNAGFRWRQLYPRDLEEVGKVLSSMPRPVVHHRHLYLHPDLRVNGEAVTWINLWREPVGRCVSRFYYSHKAFDHGYLQRPEIPRARQRSYETIDACVDAMDGPPGERCEMFDVPSQAISSMDYANACWNPLGPMSRWPDGRMPPCWEHLVQEECNELLVRWLCGQGDECANPGTEEAYETARRNMHDHYLFVGVLEELPATMRVFHKLLPDLFNHDVMAAWELAQSTGTKRRSRSYPHPSARAIDFLKSRNVYSTRLWEEARATVLRMDTACSNVTTWDARSHDDDDE